MHNRGTSRPSGAGRTRFLRRSLLLALIAVMLIFPGQAARAANATTPHEQAAGAAPTVAVADNADYGPILVDAMGMTLYMFDKDESGKSNCYGACAERWPPLLIDAGATPTAGEGVTAALDVTMRDDGTYQVTAAGWPLYYWFEDTAPGEIKGQAVGDVWWVMAPDGSIIRTAAQAEPTPEATEAPAEAAPAEATAAAAAPNVAVAAQADLGSILVGADGMTLYMFDKDEPGKSNCYDECAVRWPPLLIGAGETPVAGEGVSATLGVAERTDGTFQVTANGWPLYYWFQDTAPGEAKGQAVGDVWWVMAPDGSIIRTAVQAEPTPEATAEAAAAAAAPAEAAPAEAPAQLPVTGGDAGMLALATTGLTLLMGGSWVALRRTRR